MNDEVKRIRKRLAKDNQDHLLAFFESLTDDIEKKGLLQYLRHTDIHEVCNLYQLAIQQSDHFKAEKAFKPLENNQYNSLFETQMEMVEKYRSDGLKRISRGEVCVMLIDSDHTPLGLTGMFHPDLPSGKCLFQLFAEKIRKLQNLAENKNGSPCTIAWYIMADEKTLPQFLNCFKKFHYFGLDSKNVHFFEQDMRPCFDLHGGIILEEQHKVLTAGIGSGGLLNALKTQNIIDDMKSRNVKYIMTFSTANILTKVGDPVFIGYCLNKEADCGAKMVRKESGQENMGTFCILEDKVIVLSAKEIDPELLFLKDAEKNLLFFAGNISSYFFTLNFLIQAIKNFMDEMVPHPVRATYICLNSKGERENQNVITLKNFLSDLFPQCESFVIWEVPRISEYCTIKYLDDTMVKEKQNQLSHFYKLNSFLIETSGGHVTGKQVEISPLISYGGEGLEEICTNQRFKAPVYLGSHQMKELSEQLSAKSKTQQNNLTKKANKASSSNENELSREMLLREKQELIREKRHLFEEKKRLNEEKARLAEEWKKLDKAKKGAKKK